MSTRGLIGIVCKGKEFLTYNHYDSYPTELGLKVLRAVRALKEEALQTYA